MIVTVESRPERSEEDRQIISFYRPVNHDGHIRAINRHKRIKGLFLKNSNRRRKRKGSRRRREKGQQQQRRRRRGTTATTIAAATTTTTF